MIGIQGVPDGLGSDLCRTVLGGLENDWYVVEYRLDWGMIGIQGSARNCHSLLESSSEII